MSRDAPDWFPAYGVYLLVLVAVIGVSQVPPPYLLKRMVVEVPFVLFAVLMPFLSTGPRTDFLGLTVSEPGLMAAWALLAKGRSACWPASPWPRPPSRTPCSPASSDCGCRASSCRS